MDLKRKVFTEVDQYAGDHTLLVSSTSCIDPAKFTDKLTHKANCIVAHPVNPPHLVPLVEVIPAPYTSPEVVTRTFEILKKIGQSPVLVKKAVNGFILNRLQYALTMEAWRLFEVQLLVHLLHYKYSGAVMNSDCSGVIHYSRTWIVSTLKGRQNRYSLSEVLAIQGALNGACMR